MVAGVPTANGYDDVHTFIVRDQSQLTKETILQKIAEKSTQAALHMKLTKIHFLADIPKTTLQKPKRYLLKRIALEETIALENPLTGETASTKNIEQTVTRLIAQHGEIDSHRITLSTKSFLELGLDSLAAINLALELEDIHLINVDEIFNQDMTVADLVVYLPPDKHHQPGGNHSETGPKVKKKIDYLLFKVACVLARCLYKITVKNEQTIPTNCGYIICANHVSNLDYLWLTVNLKKEQFQTFYCMAKHEVVNKAAISQLLTRICGLIPITRDQAGSSSLLHCKDTLKANNGLLIPPEGTRSKSGQLGTLKKWLPCWRLIPVSPLFPLIPTGLTTSTHETIS